MNLLSKFEPLSKSGKELPRTSPHPPKRFYLTTTLQEKRIQIPFKREINQFLREKPLVIIFLTIKFHNNGDN